MFQFGIFIGAFILDPSEARVAQTINLHNACHLQPVVLKIHRHDPTHYQIKGLDLMVSINLKKHHTKTECIRPVLCEPHFQTLCITSFLNTWYHFILNILYQFNCKHLYNFITLHWRLPSLMKFIQRSQVSKRILKTIMVHNQSLWFIQELNHKHKARHSSSIRKYTNRWHREI